MIVKFAAAITLSLVACRSLDLSRLAGKLIPLCRRVCYMAPLALNAAISAAA